jgi:glycerol-3-phosphate dehydrogenase
MAGSLGLGPSAFISAKEVKELIPTIDTKDLKGGIVYHDGQFDDTRLAISLAQTAVQYKAAVINYCPVTALLKTNKKITGVQITDSISGMQYSIQSKTVINATGVFTDAILNMDDPAHENIIAPSQGIHLVVDRSFLPGDTAVMIPKTDDGRVLFAVPWHNKVVLGTTDTAVHAASLEPVPQEEEINFILQHIGRYLTKDPQRSDVKSMFAGLRPLVKGKAKKTAALSRDHLISINESGLITITGGKWTTYRKMAEDAVDTAITENKLTATACITKALKLYNHAAQVIDPMSVTTADIKKSVEEEMCMTVEDYLARRTRHLLLDAASAIAAAPAIAKEMAAQLQQDDKWITNQVNCFTAVAKNYLPSTFKQ